MAENVSFGGNVEISDSELMMNDLNEEKIDKQVLEIDEEIGREFENVEEMFEYMKKYAKTTGFPLRRRSSKKDSNGELKYIIYECGRGGKKRTECSNPTKPQPSIKCGCNFRTTIRLDPDTKWRIIKINAVHNHELSPNKARFFRCNRNINPRVKRQLVVNDVAGIRPSKTFKAQVIEAGGYENITFMEKDCMNYIEKSRRLRLGHGDAMAILEYFLTMQNQNPGFVFSMDVDDEGRLRNVFWADQRSREAYKHFGDVVTFDTTYLTNKYDMPFAPFVGVNHHGHSILLGCALLSNEDTDTFIWLFKTWLSCMGGRAPQGIITDQDRAMQNAIEVVFPNTRHRWCIWHIMKKIPEKFGSHNNWLSISHALKEVVYDTHNPTEFEEKWNFQDSVVAMTQGDTDDYLSIGILKCNRYFE